MIALWFCKTCGARWWTNTSEAFPHHSCSGSELERMDVDLADAKTRVSVVSTMPTEEAA